MTYDCFLYNGESDLLDLRVGTLGGIVDRFVIVESTVTFSGLPNEVRFVPPSDQFIHVVVADTPDTGDDRWARERYQRNAIVRGLRQARADDLVCMSDVDEIPDPDALAARRTGGYECQISNFWLNTIEDCLWVGPVVTFKSGVVARSPQELRDARFGFDRVKPGGWHFTSVMSPDRIKQKVQSFSHAEYDTPEGIDLILDSRMRRRSFVSMKPCPAVDVRSGYFPRYLKENLSRFEHLVTSDHAGQSLRGQTPDFN